VKEIHPLKFIKFKYEPQSRRVSIIVENPKTYNYTIFLSPLLQYMLGFTMDASLKGFKKGINKAKYPPDMTGGASSLYIYSDCVVPQIVGSTLAPLLRVVPIRIGGMMYGQPITEIFMQLHYLPVISKSLNSVEISIKTDQYEDMPFNFGKSVMKLHFVKKTMRL